MATAQENKVVIVYSVFVFRLPHPVLMGSIIVDQGIALKSGRSFKFISAEILKFGFQDETHFPYTLL